MTRAHWNQALLVTVLTLNMSPLRSARAGGAGVAASTIESSSVSLKLSGPDVSRASGRSSSDSHSNSSDSSNQSSKDSSEESSGSSDSSADEGQRKKPRKLTIPQQVRDEAVLWLAGSLPVPPSALLRSTLHVFRQVLTEEARRPQADSPALSDRALLALLLRRTEGAAAPTSPATASSAATAREAAQQPAGLVHAQAVRGAQASRPQGRVERRKQADQQGHAPDKRHLGPRYVRR